MPSASALPRFSEPTTTLLDSASAICRVTSGMLLPTSAFAVA